MGADDAVIELVTRCTSAEEFIERFARFTTATEVVVPALPHVSVGTSGTFAIYLKDRTVMMKGRCEVTEIRPASGFALMRLHVREMDAHSAGIHLRLMERHSASAKRDVPEAVPIPAAPAADDSVTVVSDTQPPPEARGPSDDEPTEISRMQRPEARVPGAAFTLPANPLGDLDAADLASFIDLSLPEETTNSVRLDPRVERARRIGRRVGPYAVCLIGGLLVGIALRSGSNAVSVAAAPRAVPPPVAAPLPAPPPPPPSAQEAADEVPDPAPRDCLARVKTKPAGAEVFWGDIALGPSPIRRAAIPCGTATVTFKREHYADASRKITADRKRSVVVTQRLRRPSAKAAATSSSRRGEALAAR